MPKQNHKHHLSKFCLYADWIIPNHLIWINWRCRWFQPLHMCLKAYNLSLTSWYPKTNRALEKINKKRPQTVPDCSSPRSRFNQSSPGVQLNWTLFLNGNELWSSCRFVGIIIPIRPHAMISFRITAKVNKFIWLDYRRYSRGFRGNTATPIEIYGLFSLI